MITIFASYMMPMPPSARTERCSTVTILLPRFVGGVDPEFPTLQGMPDGIANLPDIIDLTRPFVGSVQYPGVPLGPK